MPSDGNDPTSIVIGCYSPDYSALAGWVRCSLLRGLDQESCTCFFFLHRKSGETLAFFFKRKLTNRMGERLSFFFLFLK